MRIRYRYFLLSMSCICGAFCLGQPSDQEWDKEIQQLIKRAQGYFVVHEDREGFKILDRAIEKSQGQPAAGEFLYAKAMELCKNYRKAAEKTEAKKLLKQYVEQFPDGRHLARAIAELVRDLSSAEQEKYYRIIVNLPQETDNRPWAMQRLADLLSTSRPEEAATLRAHLIKVYPQSIEAYRTLSSLARNDFEEGRLKDAAEKLQKCLFEFTHLSCNSFEREEKLLRSIVEKRPDLKLPEGKRLPEYTPHWQEGECWEMEVIVAPPEKTDVRTGWGREIVTEVSGYFGRSMLPTIGPRKRFAYVGKSEHRDGQLCHIIRQAGDRYANSPELVLYLRYDDLRFVDAKQNDRSFDPFNMRLYKGNAPFYLPDFPLKLGKTILRAGRHRIVQECFITNNKAEVHLSHCNKKVIIGFSKNPLWWDEMHCRIRYYPAAWGPAYQVPMICRVTRSSRSDSTLDLKAELSAHLLMDKITKAMRDKRIDEMKSTGQELQTKFPKHRFCPRYLLQLANQRGTDFKSREVTLNRILRDFPSSPEAVKARKELVQNLKGEEKVEALRKFIKSETDRATVIEWHRQLLYALAQAEDYQGVLDEYKKMEAEAFKPDNETYQIRTPPVDAYWLAARAYYKLGKYRESVELFQKHKRARPGYRKSGNIMEACALVKLGRFKEAIKECQSSDWRSADIVQAFALYGMGRKEDAVAALERAAFDRLESQAVLDLAFLYEKMGKEKEASQLFTYLLDKFPEEKVFTDFVLHLYTSDKPVTTIKAFCLRKLGPRPVLPDEKKSWDLQQKHTCKSLYINDLYPWDIDEDRDPEFFVKSTHKSLILDHNLRVLWDIGRVPKISYADFRFRDKRKLIFVYSRSQDSPRRMWIDAAGKTVAQIQYPRSFKDGRLSLKSDTLEFSYGYSEDKEIIASRRKVFLRDKQGQNIWTYALGGIPETKSSERGLWAATPALQDVRPMDLDGDHMDEFLVIVEKRDVGMGMQYYLMPAGGKLVLLDKDGKAKWGHDMGTIKRISFLDCTGDGRKEVIAEDEGFKIISYSGKLLSEAYPKGYDLGDYNGDGSLELFLCSSDGITIQKLDGTQLLTVGFSEARDVAWGDITADGIPEIVFVTWNHLIVLDRKGKLLFSHDLGNKGMAQVLILDTNNDGRNDILAFGRHVDIYELVPGNLETTSSE